MVSMFREAVDFLSTRFKRRRSASKRGCATDTRDSGESKISSPSPASTVISKPGSKDSVFYFETYKCPEATRNVMTEHGVVNKLLEAHIKRLQDKAWEIFPYPCIGLFEFVKFNLPTYPAYAHVLSLLQRDHGAVYLDVGCCVGQDLRYLRSHERIPPSQLVGAELQQEFIDLGHELFLDSPEETGIRMQAADIFDAHSWLEKEMRGKCAVVHASYFLHLFNYARQREAAERLVGYLRGRPGDVIVGRMIGSAVAGEYMHPTVGVMMRHDLASFGKFWDEVGSRTGRKLKVECQIDPNTVRVSPEGKRFDHPPEEKATEMVFSITCE